MICTLLLLKSQGSDSMSHPRTGDEGVVRGDCPGGSSISQPEVLRAGHPNLFSEKPGVAAGPFPERLATGLDRGELPMTTERRSVMLWGRVSQICVMSSVLASIGAARAGSIETGLREEAPRVMKYLNDHHYGTVGVLKFEVKKGDRSASLHAGTLNAAMAARLEHALILLEDPARPIDIIHDASAAANDRTHAATFRSAAGRRGTLRARVPDRLGGPEQAAGRLPDR